MHPDRAPDATWLRSRLRLLGWAPLDDSLVDLEPANLRAAEVRALAIAWLLHEAGGDPDAWDPADLTAEAGRLLFAELRAAVSRLEPHRRDATDRGERFAAIAGGAPVRAELLVLPSHSWSTSRGEQLVGLRGDYRLYIDDPDAAWTLIPQVFAERYRPIGDDRFERTGMVHALAHQADEPREVLSPEGPMRATRGDWVLTSDAGDWWVRSESGFRAGYRRLSGNPS